MAHRRPKGPGRPIATLLALALTATAAGAQDEASRHGIFLDTVDVNIVNIEIMAFDRDGEPVTGLTLDDFEIYEDGEPIEVTNFFAVENGLRLLAPDALETAAPDPATPVAAAARPAQEQRHVVLFVDNGNIGPSHRKRVFNELYEHLDRMLDQADRVMVVSQDGEVRIEQPFTSDPALVEAAIQRLEKVAGRGAMRTTEPRLIQRHIEQGEAPPGADPLVAGTSPPRGPLAPPTWDVDARNTYSQVTSYAQLTEGEVRRTMTMLNLFIDSLAGLPGRKAVVYVSDGLELKPGEYLFRVWEYKYGTVAAQEVGITSVDSEIDRYALDYEFRSLIAAANANRVTFYTVQGGQQQDFGISAETRSVVADSLARTSDGERQDSLRTLASATGGVPLLNGAGLSNLVEQLEKDLGSYYSLGYPSPHRGDGKYHRVEVKVKREGVRLRYLEGYRDKGSDERMTDRTLASLLLDAGDNPLDIQLEIGEAEKAGKPGKGERKEEGKGLVVPVIVKVPLSKLVLLPQDDAHLGRLSIFLAVQDSQGRMSPPQKMDVPLRIPNAQLLPALSQTAGYAVRLRMRAGEQKIAVGVRDELGAVQSTVNLNVEIGG